MKKNAYKYKYKHILFLLMFKAYYSFHAFLYKSIKYGNMLYLIMTIHKQVWQKKFLKGTPVRPRPKMMDGTTSTVSSEWVSVVHVRHGSQWMIPYNTHSFSYESIHLQLILKDILVFNIATNTEWQLFVC